MIKTFIRPFLANHTHDDAVATAATEKSYGIDCSVFGGMVQFPVGAFTISLGVYPARNPGNHSLVKDAPSFAVAGANYRIGNAFDNTTTDSVEGATSHYPRFLWISTLTPSCLEIVFERLMWRYDVPTAVIGDIFIEPTRASYFNLTHNRLFPYCYPIRCSQS